MIAKVTANVVCLFWGMSLTAALAFEKCYIAPVLLPAEFLLNADSLSHLPALG